MPEDAIEGEVGEGGADLVEVFAVFGGDVGGDECGVGPGDEIECGLDNGGDVRGAGVFPPADDKGAVIRKGEGAVVEVGVEGIPAVGVADEIGDAGVVGGGEGLHKGRVGVFGKGFVGPAGEGVGRGNHGELEHPAFDGASVDLKGVGDGFEEDFGTGAEG